MNGIILLFSIFLYASCRKIDINTDKCRSCKFLVATFQTGLSNTVRAHFAGGDTAWEEKNLGKYATSETRLIEVMENVCKRSTLANMDDFTGIDNIEFKCSSQMEENEELIEEYYYKHQSRNMSEWLCIENLKLCCPSGKYGKDCDDCPGFQQGNVCSSRGKCHGDGYREGSGKCKCDDGYTGNLCRQCDSGWFLVSKDKEVPFCKKCYEGCQGECKSEGPKGCEKCKNGWRLDENQGCIDVDECENEKQCNGEHEVCVNTIGSYKCECEKDFKRDDSNKCILDIEASEYRAFLPPDLLLRFISMSSLVFIITFVVWYRSPILYFLTGLAVIALILIDLYISPDSIPDEAKRFLGY